jgi:hypothetical protein
LVVGGTDVSVLTAADGGLVGKSGLETVLALFTSGAYRGLASEHVLCVAVEGGPHGLDTATARVGLCWSPTRRNRTTLPGATQFLTLKL